MKKTIASITEKKQQGRKITVLTCYDYPTAVALREADLDIVLVGDSVGTNVLGYSSELEVTLADIAHHLSAVRRGVTDAFLLADLPAGTYATPAAALEAARHLMALGADAVKLEGPETETIRHLVSHGITVGGHLGFEPQHHSRIAVRGKVAEEAAQIYRDSIAVAAAGASLLVLELIPQELGDLISKAIPIPTIGIGAGNGTDGQVLVITDVVGYGQKPFRHNRRYREFGQELTAAAQAYVSDVAEGRFPAEDNQTRMKANELSALLQAVAPKIRSER